MRENDMAWGDFLLHGGTSFSSVQVTPHTTSNILFSSGTTGTPKAIPWNHATPVKVCS
jgi:acetyl-CoA synthetase